LPGIVGVLETTNVAAVWRKIEDLQETFAILVGGNWPPVSARTA
jgi:hypothetical protein